MEALCRVLATPLEELPRSRRKRYGQVAWELLEVGATPETLEDRAARWGDFWDGRKLNLTVDSIVKWWADLGAEERSKAAGGGPTPDARFRSMLKWAGGRGSATFPEEEDFLSVLQSSYKDLPDEAHQEALEAYRNAKRSAA